MSSLASAQTPRKTSVRKPNVILITVDTVRADHLGCYGYSDIQTPTIDGLAHDGIVFEHAIAQVPLTWPSHTVILTGTYPFQNGVQDFTGQPLDSRFRSVAQAFKQNGYSTGAVVSAFVLDRSWGLGRGFDFYDDAFSPEAFQTKDIGLVDRRAKDSVTRAINWLSKPGRRTGKPFFFWLHLYDPHSPYDPPEPYNTEYRGRLYDGEIAYADHELGRLIAWLKQNHFYDRSLIVFVSDHGESLGDHGEKEHGFFTYNSTVRVPLILKPPAGSGIRPDRIPSPVETAALAPTLLRATGIKDEMEKQFHSRSLLDRNSADEEPAYSETFYPFSSFGWSPLHSLATSRYRFIDAPTPELYDETSDLAEKNNLASQQTATAAALKDKLQTLLRRNPYTASGSGTGALNPEAQEKLRALGYVAYRSPVSAEALAAGLADPKDKIREFNAILEAEDAIHAGDFKQGEDSLARIEQQDPRMYVVPFMLGESAARRKDWQKSANELKKCLELNPAFDQAMTGLSRALFFLGDADGAKLWAQNAVKQNPQNYRAWYQLGVIEAKTDRSSAIADYEKAVAIQGNFAPLRRDLGMLYFQKQNYSEAIKNLARAAELGINEAQLYNFLGISYSRTKRTMKAIECYRQALKLNPLFAEAHLNLGFAYEQLQHHDHAESEYAEACRLQKILCK